MSRRKKDSLRPLIEAEQRILTQLSRSRVALAVQVARALMLLAVAAGSDYQQAASSAGRRSGDVVSHLVARFNTEGLFGREPTPEADGTSTWSLSTLKLPPLRMLLVL